MGFRRGRVHFAPPFCLHSLPTFLDDALGRSRLTSIDCIQQASMPLAGLPGGHSQWVAPAGELGQDWPFPVQASLCWGCSVRVLPLSPHPQILLLSVGTPLHNPLQPESVIAPVLLAQAASSPC